MQARPSTTAVLDDDSAADSQEPGIPTSPVASSESAVQEQASSANDEEGVTAAEEESATAPATPTAADAPGGVVVTGTTGEGHSQSDAYPDPAQPAAAPEVVPGKLEDSVVGEATAEACEGSIDGTAGGKAEGIAVNAEEYARGQESTDVTSDPTDDDGSDPDLSCGGDGGKDRDFKYSDADGGESEGGRFWANPALRWGGAVALVGALLVIGLRRGR